MDTWWILQNISTMLPGRMYWKQKGPPHSPEIHQEERGTWNDHPNRQVEGVQPTLPTRLHAPHCQPQNWIRRSLFTRCAPGVHQVCTGVCTRCSPGVQSYITKLPTLLCTDPTTAMNDLQTIRSVISEIITRVPKARVIIISDITRLMSWPIVLAADLNISNAHKQ